jgi:hypothetical protein
LGLHGELLDEVVSNCREMHQNFHFDVMRALRERLDALDLVTMAFMGATSDSDGFRMEWSVCCILLSILGALRSPTSWTWNLEQYQVSFAKKDFLFHLRT